MRFMPLRDCVTKGLRQKMGHTYHVRDNRIDWIDKGEIAGGKSADGDIMQQWCRVREESRQYLVLLRDSCES
jgi:hypothetical protein